MSRVTKFGLAIAVLTSLFVGQWILANSPTATLRALAAGSCYVDQCCSGETSSQANTCQCDPCTMNTPPVTTNFFTQMEHTTTFQLPDAADRVEIVSEREASFSLQPPVPPPRIS